MQQPIAKWNPARDVWEMEQTGLFCEHPRVSSGTWPRSGMTVAGQLFPLPTSGPAIGGNGSSLLLKTPTAQLASNGGPQHPDKRKAGGHGPTLEDEVTHLLPTPRTSDTNGPGDHGQGGGRPPHGGLATSASDPDSGGCEGWGTSGQSGETGPAAGSSSDSDSSGLEGPEPTGRRELPTWGGTADWDWGPYRDAVKRWQAVLGRPAPSPITTGVRGGRKLSGRFTEFMMGWPEGWVTDVPGVSNDDALRLCGNGCVPAQVAYALRMLVNAGQVTL